MNQFNNQELFESAFKYAAIGMALVGLDGRFLKVNKSLCQIVKYSEAELIQLTFQDITHPDDLDRDVALLKKLKNQAINTYKIEKRYYAKDGSLIWILLSVSLILHKDGTPKYFISQIQDISELKKITGKTEYLAYYDTLTDTLNRRAFLTELENRVKQCDSLQCEFSLLYVDVDNFKRINDLYGHLFGDNFLKAISAKLQASLSETDFLARLNGDEFVILIANKDNQPAKKLALKLLESFHTPIMIDDRAIQSTISIGIVHYPEHGNTAEQLMRHADYALYEIKHKGGNSVTIFNTVMASAYQRGMTIENKLIKAVKNHDIYTVYQPIVNLSTQDILYYEALARWQDEELGEVEPEAFIHHAEKTGIIHNLGHHLIAQVIQDIKASDNLLRVGINLSPMQLNHKTFASDIQARLQDNNITLDSIIFEFIETTLITSNSYATITVRKLEDMGAQMIIDDFGTGYASLNYIRQFNIAALKIDKSYVADITRNLNSYEIVKTVILLGKTLNFKVIAEGIETQSQLDTLRELGCLYGQGYFFARPEPISQLTLGTLEKRR